MLVKLDVLRYGWGNPIDISGHDLAIGREDESFSQHNLTKWGSVKAIDIQPRGLVTKDDADRFYMLARSYGFTGIGFYPYWKRTPGFHLDVRHDREPGNPATWGRDKNGSYVSIDNAIEEIKWLTLP